MNTPTNIVACVAASVAIGWLTNAVRMDHPSGEERIITTVATRQVSVAFTNNGEWFNITNNVKVVTNQPRRQVWRDEPQKRTPLSIRDITFPPPFPPLPTNFISISGGYVTNIFAVQPAADLVKSMRKSGALNGVVNNLATNGVICEVRGHVFGFHTRHVGIENCRQCSLCRYHEVLAEVWKPTNQNRKP